MDGIVDRGEIDSVNGDLVVEISFSFIKGIVPVSSINPVALLDGHDISLSLSIKK
jgi:hypothetical protein